MDATVCDYEFVPASTNPPYDVLDVIDGGCEEVAQFIIVTVSTDPYEGYKQDALFACRQHQEVMLEEIDEQTEVEVTMVVMGNITDIKRK